MCGEQHKRARRKRHVPGSPPRVRGTVHLLHHLKIPLGITPACAGNSECVERYSDNCRDHPRVCGEQPCPQRFPTSNKGSPPRVRGTGRIPALKWLYHGITPACAGNRQIQSDCISDGEDHPRVCGEQGLKIPFGLPLLGSPPRVRGTELVQLVVDTSKGITPACAGNR